MGVKSGKRRRAKQNPHEPAPTDRKRFVNCQNRKNTGSEKGKSAENISGIRKGGTYLMYIYRERERE